MLALAEASAETDGLGPAAGHPSEGVTNASATDAASAAATPKTAVPVRLARKPRIKAEFPVANEAAGLPAPELLVPLPTVAPFVPASAQPQSIAPASAPLPAEQAVPGRLKVSLRRSGSASTPPVPPLVPPPPSEAPFLMGPVMDGTRAPLLPIPSLGSGVPLPLPSAAGGAGELPGFLVPLAMPGPATETKDEGKAANAPKAKTDTERGVWWGRAVAAAVGAAFLVLGSYEWRQRGLWPFQPEAAGAVAAAASPAPIKPFWTVEVTGGQPVPAGVSVVDAERPAPGRDFVQRVERFKITGVLQTSPARAIVDGRIVEAGEMIDFAHGVRLVGLDQEKHLVIFEDQTSARVAVRY